MLKCYKCENCIVLKLRDRKVYMCRVFRADVDDIKEFNCPFFFPKEFKL